MVSFSTFHILEVKTLNNLPSCSLKTPDGIENAPTSSLLQLHLYMVNVDAFPSIQHTIEAGHRLGNVHVVVCVEAWAPNMVMSWRWSSLLLCEVVGSVVVVACINVRWTWYKRSAKWRVPVCVWEMTRLDQSSATMQLLWLW